MKNLLKKTVTSVALTGILISSAAFADDVPTPPVVTITAPQTETLPANITSAKNITTVKSKWAALINARITALNKLKTKVNWSKQLTADQKTNLSGMIDTNISGLAALASTLASETDITKAKVESKSTLTDYRIYAVFTPKISLLTWLDTQTDHIATLTNTTFPKLQTKLDTWKAKWIDITNFQSSLDSAKSTLATIQWQITDLTTKANALQPSDYPNASKTNISTIRAGISWITKQLTALKKSLSWKTPKAPKK